MKLHRQDNKIIRTEVNDLSAFFCRLFPYLLVFKFSNKSKHIVLNSISKLHKMNLFFQYIYIKNVYLINNMLNKMFKMKLYLFAWWKSIQISAFLSKGAYVIWTTSLSKMSSATAQDWPFQIPSKLSTLYPALSWHWMYWN